jgi:hypothetical protein
MQRKTERPMSDEDKQMLQNLADLLRSHANGGNLARHQSAAYAEVLDRIVSPRVHRYTAAQSQEQAIALAYHIVQELRGGGRQTSAIKDLAKQNKISAQQVSTYAHDWKKHAMARITQLTVGMNRAPSSFDTVPARLGAHCCRICVPTVGCLGSRYLVN